MMSSWKTLIDFILSRGNIERAMIVSSSDASLWVTSHEDINEAGGFYLREYTASIMQEDGTEREEVVNENANILLLMNANQPKVPSQGVRINATKKQQIARQFIDDATKLPVVVTRFPMGGSCIANAGKCIIIAAFNEAKNHSSADCIETVTLMANYLLKSTWPSGGGRGGADDSGTHIRKSEGAAGEVNWQSFVDLTLVGKGNVLDACIISSADGKVLASTAGFTVKTYQAEIPQEDGTDKTETVDENKNLAQLLAGSKPAQGMRINQVKYQIIRSVVDEASNCFSVHGKKTMGGCCAFHAGKVFLVATFDEKKNHNAVGCAAVLSDLAKYLRDSMA
eukprot:gene23218-31543_t